MSGKGMCSVATLILLSHTGRELERRYKTLTS